MGAEIIYEKKYPPVQLEELPEPTDGQRDPGSIPPFDALMKTIAADTTYIPIPGRRELGEKFIQTAIEVSRLYALDTRIVRHDSHISVDYSFGCGSGLRDIRHVFGMADEFSFFTGVCGADITISMDYYTHAVVRAGRVTAPDIDPSVLRAAGILCERKNLPSK